MKKINLLILFFVFKMGFCQNAVNNLPTFAESYETVEVKPDFEGGYSAFIQFIGSNFVIPDVENFSGTIKVSFIIDIDGKLKDIKILKDIGEGTAQEAIRVLKLSPPWTPGEQNGNKVKVLVNLPINIKT